MSGDNTPKTFAVHEADGQDVTMTEEKAYALVTGGANRDRGIRASWCYSIDEKMGQTYVWNEKANTLASRDYKQPQAVLVRDERK